MSLCAVGGDPVRDLKLGDGADAAAGGAPGLTRTCTAVTATSSAALHGKERFSSQRSLLARSGSGPSAADRPSFSSNSSSGSPASALASILVLTLSYCNRYLQLSQYERRRRSNAFGFLA